jgi:transcriptional antiterminator NusG
MSDTDMTPEEDVEARVTPPADDAPADEMAADTTAADDTAAVEPTVEESALDEGSADEEPPVDVGLDGDSDLDEEDEEEDELPREPSPADRPGQWFVVHTQSGYEKKVQSNLEARIQSMNMEEKIYEVVIPMEDVVEFKGNQKRVVQKKVFPGYLLVRCVMDDESWYVIRNTPGVTGFVGQGRYGQKPTPLTRREVESFLAAKTDGAEPIRQRKARLEFEVGDNVRVKEGPFADFSGQVAEINADHLKLKVLVNIFGRETLVEMDFGQVAKI